jgi:DNA repair protein RadA/Sms
MPKAHSQYVCQQCGYESTGWLGRCPNCGSWNSLVETIVESKSNSKSKRGRSQTSLTAPISLTSISSQKLARITTKIPELDRVLGGGLVAGQVVLIAGEPGIGKSTLLLQVADNLGTRQQALGTSKKQQQTSAYSLVPSAFLYISGEESLSQIKIRAERLGIKNKNIQLLEETDADEIVNTISTMQGQSLHGIVIDSIQTMQTTDLSGLAGSVGQVRECTFRLLKIAKAAGVPLFIVGHVTKEGTVAGPSVLSHIVDTVLWFEGDKTTTLRLLRAIKNRFGPTDEVGIFEMEDKGLISQTNAEKIFLTNTKKILPGSVISSIMQGSRPILVEIQSLVVANKTAFPKRIGQGIDTRRLELLIAVLIKRCGIPLWEQDVFVNVAGGISVREPASDLAICLSIASAYFDKPLAKGTIAIGEVGLLGEIREVVGEEKRVRESKRLGFPYPITQKEVKYVNEAIRKYLK